VRFAEDVERCVQRVPLCGPFSRTSGGMLLVKGCALHLVGLADHEGTMIGWGVRGDAVAI
jgi:hypothetical protein